MRRADPYLILVGLLAVAGGSAAAFGAPVAVRAAVGLPLVFVLPGYALTWAIFGSRLARAERLLLSLALTLAMDILGGVLLSISPWGLHPRSWAVLLAGATLAFGLAGTRTRFERTAVRWKPPRGTIPVALVLGLCVGVTAAAIAADRRPTAPPTWLTGYTLLWLVPEGHGTVQIGLQSGELHGTRYRVDIRSAGKLVARWATGDIAPSERWQRTLRVRGDGRVDAYLYRPGRGTRAYRHVYLHKATDP